MAYYDCCNIFRTKLEVLGFIISPVTKLGFIRRNAIESPQLKCRLHLEVMRRVRPYATDKTSVESARERKSRAHALSKAYPSVRQSSPPLEPHHWINLTNGVQLLNSLPADITASNAIRFTRIQSSHCEASAYDKILWSIDNDMLLSLAIGRSCYVYDMASRNKLRGVSRAIFLGLQFVRWSLAYLWFAADRPELVPSRVLVRGKNNVPYWRDIVLQFRIPKDTKKRLRYFACYAREMGTTDIHLYGVYGPPTQLDGCMSIHTKFVRQWLDTQAASHESQRKRTTPVWLEKNSLALYDHEATCDELREIRQGMEDQEDEDINGDSIAVDANA